MAKLVSKTYADALFEAGMDTGKIDDLYNEALDIRASLQDNEKFALLINSPKISKNEKLKILEETFEGSSSKEMLGFLRIILIKDRFDFILDILDCFILKVKEHKLIGIVEVVSADELSDDSKQKLEQKILSVTKYQKLECKYLIDESIIAGLRIRIGDRVIDSSIKTKIESMTQNLYNLQIV